LKIRIFALAKELNIDSKELIEACAKIGVVLKNSALASISPEERDKVVEYLQGHGGGGSAPKGGQPMTPVREAPRVVASRVPELKPVVRPQPTRPGRSPVAVADASEIDLTETVAPEVEETIPAEMAPAAEAYAPVAPQPAEPETGPESVDTVETVEEEAPPAVAPMAPIPNAPPAMVPRGSVGSRPLRPEDYIPASGTALRTMTPREMTPRESGSSTARPKPKAKPGPALPSLTKLGKFNGPKPGSAPAAEAPAQQPVIKLPAELLSHPRPLQEIMKINAESKRKRPINVEATAELTEEVAKGGKGGAANKQVGAGLDRSRKERQDRRRRGPGVAEEEGGEADVRIRTQKRPRRGSMTAPAKTSAEISPPITIRSLSEALGRPANVLIKSLFMKGTQATINSSIDDDVALELAMEQGIDLQIRHERDIESELEESLAAPEREEHAVPRPPIITILGHVDHGKTTLVDKIRSANVAAGEAGGITQHIAAYQVEHRGKRLTFVDTPGHAAFGEMRARGANITDIVVLVVAADDGVMPQTVEAISHARAAGVPIVVALNKIDLPGVNENKVLQELSAQNVLPAEWGGDVEVVKTSGLTGIGVEDLLETLLVTAELHDWKSNPLAQADGVCLEAFRDEGRGTLAWLIVQRGTLKLGDTVLCGGAYGRIRAMYTDRDVEVSEAGPSTPVKVSGLDIVPGPGDKFQVVDDLESARQVAEQRRSRGRAKVLSERGRPRTLEDILDPTRVGGGVRDLPIIIKADTPGSLEAIRHELGKFTHPEVRVKVMHEGVGGVNESDVYLASAAGAIIVAFHVVPEERARAIAEREGVEIREYNIIYEVTAEIKKALEGLLKPELHQIFTGRALVLKTFNISRFGTIAGCRVLNGTIDRSSRVRLIREQRVLNDYAIGSLKREKDDAREVREGMECGIRLENFNDIKEGDLLEAFKVEEIKRTL
jgi:translation initiation factor IF-2